MQMPLPMEALREECPGAEDYELALRTLHIYITVRALPPGVFNWP